ncbi:hypothetical protein [Desulfosporosinus nitroreducens]|uniref:hypothetical protein n=1 Tax=Desulfosporosinus nitroreducens TaxID=2018668 RepID=UPI00207CE65A|nr:hypothetical protein [Desulfosporosinus nitroreducens]MCO1599811.1 hypothetical protein [Desulfosporosinus nitroreducens]
MNDLISRLETNGLIDSNGNIILDENQCVEQQTFTIFFGDIFNDPSITDKYVALSGEISFQWGDPQQIITTTSESMGYQQFFDQWHQLGII